MSTDCYYAVKRGKQPGVYTSFLELKKSIEGCDFPLYKEFKSEKDAYDFLFGSFGLTKNKLGLYQELQLTKKYSSWPSTFVSYTDGSKKNNNSSYGFIGVVNNIIQYEEANLIDQDNASHIVGEFEAVIRTIQHAVNNNFKRVFIFYDYAQIREVLNYQGQYDNECIQNYQEFVYKQLSNIEIEFIKVKAHRGNQFNEYVNDLVKRIC